MISSPSRNSTAEAPARSANALDLAAKTVEGAISVIFSKLGLEEDERDNRRVLAVLVYLDGGTTSARSAEL
ncbi:MAG TPA: hypothetical protein VM344_07880 [Vitreimonas sp.]|nr:hypothetical protein [Vitreimonas sp.]